MISAKEVRTMIQYNRPNPEDKERYDRFFLDTPERGCEYSFTNVSIWGRQKYAFVEGFLTILAQFDRRCVYPFPVGNGDVKPVLDAIIHDARARGIPCCLTGLRPQDRETLERLYPGVFRFHEDRDGFDYVYSIDDLAELKGRKFQKKRNHLNRFLENYPDHQLLPLDENTLGPVKEMLAQWFETRKNTEPHNDFHLEMVALDRAFANMKALQLEGLVLVDGGRVLAFTMGSRLNRDTFDIHFEKALEDVDGAYPAINRGFSRYLREKYPEIRWLNREDDIGLEGLRKAKLSYNPDRLIDKYWARLWETEDERC